jgi:hypothetical protein
MNTKIITDDEEQSLDDLVKKARTDSKLKQLMQGKNIKESVLRLAPCDEAIDFVKSVEENGLNYETICERFKGEGNIVTFSEASLLAATYCGLGRKKEAELIMEIVQFPEEPDDKLYFDLLCNLFAHVCLGRRIRPGYMERFYENLSSRGKLSYQRAYTRNTALLANICAVMGNDVYARYHLLGIDEHIGGREVRDGCYLYYQMKPTGDKEFDKRIGFEIDGNALISCAKHMLRETDEVEGSSLLSNIYDFFSFDPTISPWPNTQRLTLAIAHMAKQYYENTNT